MTRFWTFLASACLTAFLAPHVMAGETPSNPDTKLYIISPNDGASVTSPVTVVFGLAGMGVAPAGVEKAGTGHHHLLVNIPEAEIDLDNPLPAFNEGNEAVIHFGGGQTEATIDLPPGTYELRLVLGDQNHVPHNPPVISAPISVTVE